MDPVLTDCYVWLYDQAEYVAMALHTWHQLGQEVPRHRFATVMTYVLKFGRDPPPSLQLLPDEPLSPAHQQGLQQQLQGSPTQQHGSSAVSLLREGVGSRGSGLMDLMLLRRVSSLASSTSSLFQEGGSLCTPLSSHSSYGGAVKEGMRVALVSVLCDLSQVPFLNVSLSAMVGEGRLPELFPFQGYGTAFRAIIAAEGAQGLFTGWVWVCGVGLCENFSLIHSQLQGDEDEPEEEEEEDDTSVLTHHHHTHRRQDDDNREGRQGRPPIRMRDYQALLETTTAALQAEVQWVSGGVMRLWQCLSPNKAQPSPNGNPQIPPNTELSLRPSPYSSTSLVSHHHTHNSRRSHSWLTQGWRNPATVVSRVCKALVSHPLPLLALHAITRKHTPQHIRRECGGWGGLWSGAYTSIFMALYREPLLCLFSAPFVIRSRRMLLLNKTGSASAALGAAAVPLLGRQTLGLLTTILKQEGLVGVWSGSRALLWGVLPSMACCLLTRLGLKLLGLADSPRKTRRDRRRVEYIKYLLRQWDWNAPRPSPSSPQPSSPSYPHNGPSLGDAPIEPLDGHYRPFAAQPLPPPSLSHSSAPSSSSHGANGRGLLSSRHHHQHLPLQPPPFTPGQAPPPHGESTPLTANVGLSLSPEGAYSVGSTGSLGIASQPSPYVTTQLTRSGPMDGSGGYDADMSNSTASNTH